MLDNNKGFTLIEILVAIAILGVVSAAILGFLVNSFDFFNQASDKVEVQRDLRPVSKYITTQIRNSTDVSIYNSVADANFSKEKSKTYNYIYLNTQGKIIHLKNSPPDSFPVETEISLNAGYEYSLNFQRGQNGKIIHYKIKNKNKDYVVESNIFLQNAEKDIPEESSGSVIEYKLRKYDEEASD